MRRSGLGARSIGPSNPSAGAALLLAAGLFLATTGCQPNEEGPAAKPRIALIMKSLANEFFQTMEEGARKHQQEHAEDYDLIVNGIKDELDVARQIDLAEQMIAQGVNAIVLAPADSKALVAVAKKAQDAGIAVVNIDNKLDAEVLAEKGARIPFVGPNNEAGARMVGAHLAERLQPGDRVAILEGAPNAFNGVQRKLGFAHAMKDAGMSIVAIQSGYWETTKANQAASAIITEHPDLKAFLCANDSMALGVVAALRMANKQDDILVVGYDNISAVGGLLREGRMLATADQHADQLAVYGIEYALRLLRGEASLADQETPVELITKESLPKVEKP